MTVCFFGLCVFKEGRVMPRFLLMFFILILKSLLTTFEAKKLIELYDFNPLFLPLILFTC